MNRKLRWVWFTAGFILLMMILKYQFTEDDSWKAWNLPLTGKVIYLDPGHGGPDGGATGASKLEKEVALSISLKLRDYLQEQGALVLMTREKDTDLADPGTKGYSRRKEEDLRNRVNMINDSNADLFLSIHLNAIPSPKWSGAQTFYFGKFEENKRAARFIQDELRTVLNNTDRRAKQINGIYLMKYAEKPGALVEVGFLSNPQEDKLLADEAYQNQLAASIYRGVLRYYTSKEDPPE
ncbi:N-acetylmuramoyl-L-alanine amidase CwlD [Bacillus lacus]|uniref:N-acetylmuramoyl-L-alanine amidase CwlD n=1 Tax=Metabacillus lacus TaxID=1983721 RepID=A0A7X2M080_9BACI|nr:N-acetylmuramoyl-L-alanine amidase CwlD [Metabacillus lacus]MRX72499.1 N-acetylmuramoyl-L-alanine amidase CwlD [Metabacillus lacus]